MGAEQRYTKVRNVWTNGKAERFIQTLKDALPGMLRAKLYGSVAALQTDLDRGLEWVQHPAPHQGRYNRGRPPTQVVCELQGQQDSKAA